MKRTIILNLTVLALAIGAYQVGRKEEPGKFTQFETVSDPSPIIITDGGSIHFAQHDQWYYGQKMIAAVLPKHRVHSLKIGLCTLRTSPANQPDDRVCDADLLNASGLNGKSWTLYLCATSACSEASFGAKIRLDKNHDLGGNGDKGSDMQINLMPGSPASFNSEPDTLDGPSLYLGSMGLKYANFVPDIGSSSTANCAGSVPGSKPCTVRICYATSICQ